MIKSLSSVDSMSLPTFKELSNNDLTNKEHSCSSNMNISLFVERIFSEHSLYDETESIKFLATELQELMRKLVASCKLNQLENHCNIIKETITKTTESMEKIKDQINKILTKHEYIKKDIKIKLNNIINKRDIHVSEIKVLAKQKLEQAKTKYKLKRHGLKDLIRKYKASEQAWEDKYTAMQEVILFIILRNKMHILDM